MADPRYSILFEPVRIGPVTARNRFYQVPHCTGLGHLRPRADAATRAIKAEGGWAVVSNQETEIHPSSDLTPFPEHRLWDERDIPALRLMTERVHEHGALAAIELVHNGYHAANLGSRAPVLAPSDVALHTLVPKQARAMDKSDLRDLRRWHRAAALRAKEAGFDIVYCYAGHGMTIAQHFLSPLLNTRGDEYGGSLENRARLLRELVEDTKEAVGDTCAVALRFAVDEMQGVDGMQAHEEGRAVVELLSELPDLWDVNVSDWSNDSATSRFAPEEGYQTDYIRFVKEVTSRPVVGVGRFTSPDHMVSLVNKGVVDFIGAARPSIADPFLPAKVEEGRVEEIRECIGCNICVASDNMGVPIRCTQNPTMGEEWRRGWHPEKVARVANADEVLIVGGGPAGLECAMQFARAGAQVTLAEAGPELGGRARREAGLKGLGAWGRVRDYREHDLRQRANVNIYSESPLDADQVVELGIPHVFVASGATWRRDGIGRTSRRPISTAGDVAVFTPDDIMDGSVPPDGPVVIYDDDQIYMGGVLADHLRATGADVTLVTPAPVVSPWTEMTLEQVRIQRSLIEAGVEIVVGHSLVSVAAGVARLACVYSNGLRETACASLIMVTERVRETALFDALSGRGLETLELIGDAAQPGLIADAVYSGHAAFRAFGRSAEEVEAEMFRREVIEMGG
ncbi:FAD-dependent oxidoreductase [Roseovarius sp. SCSIO 43702]|uniref:oxidoreductase n=1 Tax=Roseovarius sp. SCSIO 43702 TaxID=2823043 RepID=UPI001C7378ED|nr:NAD-binding protein [Roseovarius sp. SCSIO 43702]QYX57526.1 FAD-dependent oxidoreductase [Roseovarius sp. SCSIO 43702]